MPPKQLCTLAELVIFLKSKPNATVTIDEAREFGMSRALFESFKKGEGVISISSETTLSLSTAALQKPQKQNANIISDRYLDVIHEDELVKLNKKGIPFKIEEGIVPYECATAERYTENQSLLDAWSSPESQAFYEEKKAILNNRRTHYQEFFGALEKTAWTEFKEITKDCLAAERESLRTLFLHTMRYREVIETALYAKELDYLHCGEQSACAFVDELIAIKNANASGTLPKLHLIHLYSHKDDHAFIVSGSSTLKEMISNDSEAIASIFKNLDGTIIDYWNNPQAGGVRLPAEVAKAKFVMYGPDVVWVLNRISVEEYSTEDKHVQIKNMSLKPEMKAFLLRCAGPTLMEVEEKIRQLDAVSPILQQRSTSKTVMDHRSLADVVEFFKGRENAAATVRELKEFGVSQAMFDNLKSKQDGLIIYLSSDTVQFSEEVFHRRFGSQFEYAEGVWERYKQRFVPANGVSVEEARGQLTSVLIENAKRQNLLVTNITYPTENYQYKIDFLPVRFSTIDESTSHLVLDYANKTTSELMKQSKISQSARCWELGAYYKSLAETTPQGLLSDIVGIIEAQHLPTGMPLGEPIKVSGSHQQIKPLSLSQQARQLGDGIHYDEATKTLTLGKEFYQVTKENYPSRVNQLLHELKLGAAGKAIVSITFKRILPAVGIVASTANIAYAEDKAKAVVNEATLHTGGIVGSMTMVTGFALCRAALGLSPLGWLANLAIGVSGAFIGTNAAQHGKPSSPDELSAKSKTDNSVQHQPTFSIPLPSILGLLGQQLHGKTKGETHELKQQQPALSRIPLTSDATDKILEYAQAAFEVFSDDVQHPIDNIVAPVLNGFAHGLDDLHKLIKHPIEALYQITLFNLDAATIICHASQNYSDPELKSCRDALLKEDSFYANSCRRMQERMDHFKAFGKAFLEANHTEKLQMAARFLTTIYVPGTVIKAVQGMHNLGRVGQFNPAVYKERRLPIVTELREMKADFREYLKNFLDFSEVKLHYNPKYWSSIDEIRALSKGSLCEHEYAYVILRNGEFRAIHQDLGGHGTLTRGQPILMGGDLVAKNGRIVKVDNRTGDYTPYIERKVLTHVFKGMGVPEINIPGVIQETYSKAHSIGLGMRRSKAIKFSRPHPAAVLSANLFHTNESYRDMLEACVLALPSSSLLSMAYGASKHPETEKKCMAPPIQKGALPADDDEKTGIRVAPGEVLPKGVLHPKTKRDSAGNIIFSRLPFATVSAADCSSLEIEAAAIKARNAAAGAQSMAAQKGQSAQEFDAQRRYMEAAQAGTKPMPLHMQVNVPLPSKKLLIDPSDTVEIACAKIDAYFEDIIRNYPKSTKKLLREMYYHDKNVSYDFMFDAVGACLHKQHKNDDIKVVISSMFRNCPIAMRRTKIHEIGVHAGQMHQRIEQVGFDAFSREFGQFAQFTEQSVAIEEHILTRSLPEEILDRDLGARDWKYRLYALQNISLDDYVHLKHRNGTWNFQNFDKLTPSDHESFLCNPQVSAFLNSTVQQFYSGASGQVASTAIYRKALEERQSNPLRFLPPVYGQLNAELYPVSGHSRMPQSPQDSTQSQLAKAPALSEVNPKSRDSEAELTRQEDAFEEAQQNLFDISIELKGGGLAKLQEKLGTINPLLTFTTRLAEDKKNYPNASDDEHHTAALAQTFVEEGLKKGAVVGGGVIGLKYGGKEGAAIGAFVAHGLAKPVAEAAGRVANTATHALYRLEMTKTRNKEISHTTNRSASIPHPANVMNQRQRALSASPKLSYEQLLAASTNSTTTRMKEHREAFAGMGMTDAPVKASGKTHPKIPVTRVTAKNGEATSAAKNAIGQIRVGDRADTHPEVELPRGCGFMFSTVSAAEGPSNARPTKRHSQEAAPRDYCISASKADGKSTSNPNISAARNGDAAEARRIVTTQPDAVAHYQSLLAQTRSSAAKVASEGGNALSSRGNTSRTLTQSHPMSSTNRVTAYLNVEELRHSVHQANNALRKRSQFHQTQENVAQFKTQRCIEMVSLGGELFGLASRVCRYTGNDDMAQFLGSVSQLAAGFVSFVVTGGIAGLIMPFVGFFLKNRAEEEARRFAKMIEAASQSLNGVHQDIVDELHSFQILLQKEIRFTGALVAEVLAEQENVHRLNDVVFQDLQALESAMGKHFEDTNVSLRVLMTRDLKTKCENLQTYLNEINGVQPSVKQIRQDLHDLEFWLMSRLHHSMMNGTSYLNVTAADAIAILSSHAYPLITIPGFVASRLHLVFGETIPQTFLSLPPMSRYFLTTTLFFKGLEKHPEFLSQSKGQAVFAHIQDTLRLYGELISFIKTNEMQIKESQLSAEEKDIILKSLAEIAVYETAVHEMKKMVVDYQKRLQFLTDPVQQLEALTRAFFYPHGDAPESQGPFWKSRPQTEQQHMICEIACDEFIDLTQRRAFIKKLEQRNIKAIKITMNEQRYLQVQLVTVATPATMPSTFFFIHTSPAALSAEKDIQQSNQP